MLRGLRGPVGPVPLPLGPQHLNLHLGPSVLAWKPRGRLAIVVTAPALSPGPHGLPWLQRLQAPAIS